MTGRTIRPIPQAECAVMGFGSSLRSDSRRPSNPTVRRIAPVGTTQAVRVERNNYVRSAISRNQKTAAQEPSARQSRTRDGLMDLAARSRGRSPSAVPTALIESSSEQHLEPQAPHQGARRHDNHDSPEEPLPEGRPVEDSELGVDHRS